MSDKNDGGDKTEKPTPKRLEDARKKGDISKSREVTSTAVLAAALALGMLSLGYATDRLAALLQNLFSLVAQGWGEGGFAGVVRSLGMQAMEAALLLSALLMVPLAALGLLVEFLQAGPVMSFEKLKPKLENLNPVAGVKKMFSMDSLVEVLKAVLKTALLFLVGWLLVRSALPQMVGLAGLGPQSVPRMVDLLGSLTLRLLTWTVALFALLSLLDAAYQRFSFTKKMRMSIRDIKQEMKESEGDPHVKQHRRQAAQEWSQRNSAQAARNANVLVVNPTHVAIAIHYDRDTSPVPTIAAKGEDEEARVMREAAFEAGVPVVRNVPLARDLLARGEVGEIIPADLFDIIAEVVLWAREVRAEVALQRGDTIVPTDIAQRRTVAAPGEDLTQYPKQAPWNPSH
ncbi:flagellar biosynthesis pathway, component FlhB [Burkholderiales bacterium JOSHI_001]|nr:flagellar biosynthesis pathway, component FlhB [Burkholderiales bacterium JOSHI_001]